MTIHRLLLTGLCAALALPPASGNALAQAFDPGDALVLDLLGDRIIRVKLGGSNEGDQSVVASGGPVSIPRGLAIASQRGGGLFITSDTDVVRVQAEEDRQDVVTQFFAVTYGITFDENEDDLFVTAPPWNSYTPAITRVDRVTGISTVLSYAFDYPRGIALDPSDTTKLLVVEAQRMEPFSGIGVYQFDPDDLGALPTPISTTDYVGQELAGEFTFPQRLAATDGQYIYVTDLGYGGEPPKVVQVDRDNPDLQANQKVVALGGYLQYPVGIAIEQVTPEVRLLVADADAKAVIRIYPDRYPAPNHQEIVSPNGGGQNLFDTPWEIQIVPPLSEVPLEDLLVTEAGATPGDTDTGVFKVDPEAGTRTNLATGPDFSRPTGALVDHATGELAVVDAGNQTVHRVDRTTGATTLVASGGDLVAPSHVMVDADGSYLVADPGAKALIRIDPDAYDPGDPASNQQIVSPQGSESSLDFFERPTAMVIQDDGRLLVADAGDPQVADDGRLIEVDPVFGRQICVAEDALLEEVTGMVRDRDGSLVFAGAGTTPVFRLASPGFLTESESSEYASPAGLPLDANRDILVVDAGDPQTLGDGRVLRLDPLEPEPSVVAGSEGLSDPSGIALDAVPEAPPAFLETQDSDGDGVGDVDDNCVADFNPDQRNTNPANDVFGNACDADFDGDGTVGVEDFTTFLIQWGKVKGVDADFDPDVDLDDDGFIGVEDFTTFVRKWSHPPGPAGSRAGLDPQGPCSGPGASP